LKGSREKVLWGERELCGNKYGEKRYGMELLGEEA
jgi:hypothetical protein